MTSYKLRIASIILSIIGLIDSIYLSWLKLGKDEIVCIGGCDVVNNSKYAEIFGIPVALIGAFAYIFILLLLLFENVNEFFQDNSSLIVFGMSLIGVIYSIYLTYLELYIIHAICPYCVVSAVVLLFLLIASILRLRLELEY